MWFRKDVSRFEGLLDFDLIHDAYGAAFVGTLTSYEYEAGSARPTRIGTVRPVIFVKARCLLQCLFVDI